MENRSESETRKKRNLAAFDPRSEKWEIFPLDPEGKVKEWLQPHTPVVDAKQTRKVEMFTAPSRPSAPYGIDIDDCHDYDAIASRKALREKPQRQAAVK